jgi:hypothetical protein
MYYYDTPEGRRKEAIEEERQEKKEAQVRFS